MKPLPISLAVMMPQNPANVPAQQLQACRVCEQAALGS